MANQKFHRGDRVRIAKDLGTSMSHFSGAGEEAIVLGSYRDVCRVHSHGDPRDKTIFALHILPNKGHSSWYHDFQLTPIRGKHGLRYADELDGTEYVKPKASTQG